MSDSRVLTPEGQLVATAEVADTSGYDSDHCDNIDVSESNGGEQLLLWGGEPELAASASAAGTNPEPAGPVLIEVAAEDPEESAPEPVRRGTCPGGHPYDEANTYVNPRGARSCRTCQREARGRWRARNAKNLTAEQRVLRSRMAAYRLHATHDPRETTKKARAAFANRFEREVDPEGVLAPAERARRAEAARRAYFTELALRSSRARHRGA